MSRLLSKACLTAVLVAGIGSFGPRAARAQGIPVYDNTAFIELVQKFQQGAQQLAALQQQVQAQLQMLQSLPGTIMPELGPMVASTQQLMGEIQNVRYMGSTLQGNLDSLYPTSFGSSDPQEILAQIATMTTANRQAIVTAQQLQNEIAGAQPQVSAAVSSAVAASQAAPGPTAVAQATNQILAAQSAQLGQLQSILIADERQREQTQLERDSADSALAQVNAAPLAPLNAGAGF